MNELGLEVQGNGFATTCSFIKGSREIVKAALKGYVEATYTWFVRRVAKKPYPTLKGIQFLLDEFAPKFPQANSAKPEQFVDLGLLQELEKEGFFSAMGKRYP